MKSAEHQQEDMPTVDKSNTSIVIHDSAAKQVRDWSDIIKLVFSLLFTVGILFVAVWFRSTTEGAEQDMQHASNRFHWLVQLPLSFLLSLTLIIIVAIVLTQLLLARMWIQSVVATVGLFAGFIVSSIFGQIIVTYFNDKLGEVITQASNWFGAGPFELFTTIFAFLTAANNRGIRSRIKWSWETFYILAFIVLAANTITITGLLVSIGLGYCLGLAVRFLIGSPGSGVWGEQLVSAVQSSTGIRLTSLKRLPDDETFTTEHFASDCTELTRLYEATDTDGRELIIAVNDAQQHAIDYLVQLWKTIKLEGLTFHRYRSVHDMAEHHFTVLLRLNQLNLATNTPIAIGETTESDFFIYQKPDDTFHPVQFDTCTDDQIIHLMSDLEIAHQHGLTHRNIMMDYIGQRDDHSLILTGWSNGDVISNTAHEQIDRVQLLALLSAVIGLDRTIKLAHRVMDDKHLSSIAPYTQAVIIPLSTKQLPQWDKHLIKNLRTRLAGLSQTENLESAQPVQLSRFSVRRFITGLLVVLALIVVFTQLNFDQVIKAVKDADPWWALAGFVIGIISWAGSGIAFGSFIDKEQRKGHYLGILGTQAAASFAAVSMPALAGPVAVNITFLRKIGYKASRATAIASADMVAEFTTTFLMFIVFGIFTGQNALQNILPGKMVIIVIGIIGAACAIAMLIPAVRRWIQKTLIPILRSYGQQLIELFSHPSTLIISMLGSVGQNMTLAMAFWFSLIAFGYHADFIETIFLFLLANAIGQAVPTPGGLGAIETVLSAAFIGIGVPSAIAVSATLLFRVETYWLRMVLGGFYMKWMEKKKLL